MSTQPDPAETRGDQEDYTRTIHIPGAAPGGVIGHYKLIRQIGEGGMGVVYHAEQLQPIRRGVALKIIKPGMDSKQVIARFESERQALALMDHPNIARVFDAGATAAGLPYFVMELVSGVPITAYCDAKRLTLRQRIELFLPVCQAIQHAHQRGIIHRDIKPSNILVAEFEGKPMPKVIDFGLAKALGRQLNNVTMMTTIGMVVGTLEYMSPEQAATTGLDIDTRSDVYSLGAVFYELLTGTTPLERDGLMNAGFMEALRYVREQEPPTPSARLRRSTASMDIAALRQSDAGRLPNLLHGELDWIAMKALDKDRTRRYETVNGLKRDCERYLAGEPVEAAPQSAVYRMRKFARKHRRWLATAAVFAALMIAGVVVSTAMAIRARRAEKAALRDRNVASAVNNFLQNDLLAQASASNQLSTDGKPDPDLKVRTVLDRSAARIEGRFRSEPEVEASVRLTIGAAYLDLGLNAEALRQLERAVKIRRRSLGPEHPDTLAALGHLGAVYREQGKYPEAERLYQKLVESEKRILGSSDPETLRSMNGLSKVLDREGKYPEAETLARQVLESQQRNPGPESPDTLDTMNGLASIYTEERKYAEAEPLFTRSLEINRRLNGPDHPNTLGTMSDLSVLYSIQKRHAEAEDLKTKTLAASRRILGPEHPYTLKVMSNLAVTYSDEKKYAESEALNRQTCEIMRRVLGPEHPSTLIALNNLSVAYKSMGKFRDAFALDTQVLVSFQRLLGPNHPNTLASKSNLSLDHLRLGQYHEAATLFRELLDQRRRTLQPQDPSLLRTAYHLADALYLEGRHKEAEALLRDDLAIYEVSMRDNWERYRCQSLLGAVLSAQKKYPDAEPLLLEGIEGLLRQESAIAWYAVGDPDRALRNLVDLYRAWGKPASAVKWKSQLHAREIAAKR